MPMNSSRLGDSLRIGRASKKGFGPKWSPGIQMEGPKTYCSLALNKNELHIAESGDIKAIYQLVFSDGFWRYRWLMHQLI